MKANCCAGLQQLPGSADERCARFMHHGSMAVEVYAPQGTDAKQPHSQDELYFEQRGHGEFVKGEDRHRFEPGDAFFVPAAQVHRFENFNNDFATWVVFYGPMGGEHA